MMKKFENAGVIVVAIIVIGLVVLAKFQNGNPTQSSSENFSQAAAQATNYPQQVIAMGSSPSDSPRFYQLRNEDDFPAEPEVFAEDTAVYFLELITRPDGKQLFHGNQTCGTKHKVGILSDMANAFPSTVEKMSIVRDDVVARDLCLAQNGYTPSCAVRYWNTSQDRWSEVADGIIVECLATAGSDDCGPNRTDGFLSEKWKLPKGTSGDPVLLDRIFKGGFSQYGPNFSVQSSNNSGGN